jgi:hypothetical protein
MSLQTPSKTKPGGRPDKPKVIRFRIDQQKFETEQAIWTAGELLSEFAEVDPSITNLGQKKGNELVEYDDGDTVALENGMKFVTISDQPTHVS